MTGEELTPTERKNRAARLGLCVALAGIVTMYLQYVLPPGVRLSTIAPSLGAALILAGLAGTLVGIWRIDYREEHGIEPRPTPRLIYSFYWPALEAHELTHMAIARAFGWAVERVYHDDGRPGVIVEHPRGAPLRALLAVDLAPTIVGLPVLVWLAPWLLAALTAPPATPLNEQGVGTMDAVTRVLIAANVAVYASPSWADLARLAALLTGREHAASNTAEPEVALEGSD